MTNKKFKLAAMSLATAVALSTVGPSASAVTYYLSDGSVTVDQDNNGAYSYQNKTDGKTENVYVDEDTQDNGQIIIKQTQQRVIPSLWKKMSRTKMANAMWISSLTA